MKSSYFITALFCIKTTLAGIEIPRDGCEWFSGTTYGVDIKCDGNFSKNPQFIPVWHLCFKVKLGDKEWWDSKQPDNSEPFPMTNLPFYFINSEQPGVDFCVFTSSYFTCCEHKIVLTIKTEQVNSGKNWKKTHKSTNNWSSCFGLQGLPLGFDTK